MDFFSDSLLRLKHYLRVSKDQEVANALGLSKTAFSERKKRSSFPEKELRALAQQRPELGIDVEYVLTGGRLPAHERRAQCKKGGVPGTLPFWFGGATPNAPDMLCAPRGC